MRRIVFDANETSARQLDQVADELDLSKVKALQLAVSVLFKLSEEVGRGTELVLRQQSGREVELWLPHLRRSVAEVKAEEPNTAAAVKGGKTAAHRATR